MTKDEKNEKRRLFYLKNKDKIKEKGYEYRKKNADRIKECKRLNYIKHRDIINEQKRLDNIKNADIINEQKRLDNIKKAEKKKEQKRLDYIKHKDKRNEQKKEYRKKNADKIKEQKRISFQKNGYNKEKRKEYRNNREKTDKLYKITKQIRTAVKRALNNNKDKKTTVDILGCSFEEFKKHIESKFEPWMNWDNYGNWNGYPKELNTSWDLDHIIPVSSAKTEEDVIKLNHYSNIQPLCSVKNRHIKRDNI